MDKFDLKKFITEGKLVKEERYTKIEDFDDYITILFNMSVSEEEGMQSGIWSHDEEGDYEKYDDAIIFKDLVDFLKVNGEQTLEGNPDIVVGVDGEDIRWSAMVTLDESKSLKENEGGDFEESILKIVNELKEYNSTLSPGNYIKWKLDKAIEELEGILDEDEIELSSVSKPIKDEPKPETLDLDENKSLNESKVLTGGEVAKALRKLDQKYDDVISKDFIIKVKRLKRVTKKTLEKMGAKGKILDDIFDLLKESKSLNELDSLSNVFDTITGEYEDDEGKVVYAPYTYNDLKDLLNSTFKSSRNVDDFIEKVTYSITNTTSVLSLEDQDKLHDWYDVRSEYGSQNESVNEVLKQQLTRGKEYSVLEPGLNQFQNNLEFIGYDSNEGEYVFIDSTNIAPGSIEVYFLRVGEEGLKYDVKEN